MKSGKLEITIAGDLAKLAENERRMHKVELRVAYPPIVVDDNGRVKYAKWIPLWVLPEELAAVRAISRRSVGHCSEITDGFSLRIDGVLTKP